MKLYYTVAESWQGEIGVHSFGGKTASEERQYARNGSKKVYWVGTDYQRAWRECAAAKAKQCRKAV